MITTLVFATHNLNKLEEAQKILPKTIRILSLEDIGCFNEIPETGATLEENAQLKADYVTQNFGYHCFADDTALAVESLGGAPGVFSARYAGEAKDSEKNIQKLLSALAYQFDRRAVFKTVIALNIDKKQFLFDGICKGTILREKQGKMGFGYDSVFKPIGFGGSFATMTLTEKNKISHRKKAIAKLVAFLTNY